jgi:hypothetical protein
VRRVTTTIGLLGLFLFALLAPTPASAATDVEVTSATLVAHGVAVDLTITVNCASSLSGGAEMSLRQRSGDRVAYGSGWTAVHCTGAPQAVTARVYAEAGGFVFNKGVALAVGGGEVGCDYSPRFEGEVRVTR